MNSYPYPTSAALDAALDLSEATALALMADGLSLDEAIERAADAAMASLRVQA